MTQLIQFLKRPTLVNPLRAMGSLVHPAGPPKETTPSTWSDILFINHDSSTFRQSSNPVCGSWKSQASSLWAKQHRGKPVPSRRNHIQGWMTVWICYWHALEKGCLRSSHSRCLCAREWVSEWREPLTLFLGLLLLSGQTIKPCCINGWATLFPQSSQGERELELECTLYRVGQKSLS